MSQLFMFSDSEEVRLSSDSSSGASFHVLCESQPAERLETVLKLNGYRLIAGVDEAGRGPLAGPVVACACIVPDASVFPGLTDSKKLTASQRDVLYQLLISHPDIEYAVATVSAEEIDQMNILQATFKAMRLALSQIRQKASCVLIDGNRVPPSLPAEILSHAVIKGDLYCPSISAASIIAKVTRDRLVDEYDRKWPHFQFRKHKGYGTKLHLELLRLYGILPVHRKTFRPIHSLQALEQGTLF